MSSFRINLLFWSCLAMMADGFDSAGLASAAPALAAAWQVPRGDFGPALSASLFGMLLGAPLLGQAGDRFGRRPMIVLGCVIFSVPTLAIAWSHSLWQLGLLRVITGFGLGGIMPNLVALNAELAPPRSKSTLVVLMFTGISIGAGLPGMVQAWLIPSYGWQVMFWLGGSVPLAIAAALIFVLPESPARPTSATHHRIFAGPLRYITPLLWICVVAALMANFFLNSWLPLLLDGFGLTAQQTGTATTLYHYSGVLGGILVSLLLARYGFGVLCILFLAAIPAIVAIGLPGAPIAVMAALAGFSTLGAQFGNVAVSSIIYPAPIRASGVGWALGVGRLGSIAGPLVGGWLIAMSVPTQRLFVIASLPMLLGAAACAAVSLIRYRAIGSLRLEEEEVVVVMPGMGKCQHHVSAAARAGSGSQQ